MTSAWVKWRWYSSTSNGSSVLRMSVSASGRSPAPSPMSAARRLSRAGAAADAIAAPTIPWVTRSMRWFQDRFVKEADQRRTSSETLSPPPVSLSPRPERLRIDAALRCCSVCYPSRWVPRACDWSQGLPTRLAASLSPQDAVRFGLYFRFRNPALRSRSTPPVSKSSLISENVNGFSPNEDAAFISDMPGIKQPVYYVTTFNERFTSSSEVIGGAT
jgi:hypothetical protein